MVRRKGEINKVISILLDLHDAFRSGSAVYLLDHIGKLPDSDVKRKSIVYVNELVMNLIKGSKISKVKRIIESFTKEVENLAQYDPISAFKLRGLEKIMEDVEANIADALKTVTNFGKPPETFRADHIILKTYRNTEVILRNQILWLT